MEVLHPYSTGKSCKACGDFKQNSEFYLKEKTKDGYDTSCKECRKVQAKQAYRRRRPTEHKELFAAVGYSCQICGDSRHISIDYFPNPKPPAPLQQVRGVLCLKCKRSLLKTIKLHRRAIAYLRGSLLPDLSQDKRGEE